jgi:hypothetical protein
MKAIITLIFSIGLVLQLQASGIRSTENLRPSSPEYRPFQSGSMDALAPFPIDADIKLVQLDLITEELLLLANSSYPEMQLWKGTCSYHRIMTQEIYNDLLVTLGGDYCFSIVDHYMYHPELFGRTDRPEEYYPDDCVNYGNDYFDTDGSIYYGPDCIDPDYAICIGYYDGWGDEWGCAYYNCPIEHDCQDITSWAHWCFRVKGDMCDATGNVQAFFVGSDGEWIYPGVYLPEDYGISDLYYVSGNWQDWTPDCHLRIVIESEDNYDCEWVQFDWAYYYNENPCDEDNGEPDNNDTQANEIEDGDTHYHTICPVEDQDWSYFEVVDWQDALIETNGDDGDTELWLCNSNLVVIAYDDDSGNGLFSRIYEERLNEGTYYILVREFGNDDPIEAYTLSLGLESIATLTEPLNISVGNPCPNPFNPSTTIEFNLLNAGMVEFTMYNITGSVVDQNRVVYNQGANRFTWNAASLPSGIYFIVANHQGVSQMKKCMLLK